MDKFKKQDYKPESSFDKEQVAYLEDKLTSFMLRLHVVEKESKKIKLELEELLKEIRGKENV